MVVENSVSIRAGRREWIALAVLMIPVLLVSVDNTVLSFALPEISAELNPSGNQLLWIVDLYALLLAGLLIAMGSLGDRLGRRRLLVVGSVGFGAASLVAAFSNSPEMLIFARALLGIFGATLMPSTLSLIRNVFTHDRDRRLAIATWAAMFSGGAVLGPVLGGWLLEHFWWGSVFLINVPLIVVFVPLALILLPESKDEAPGPIDPLSIALSVAAMGALVFGIKHVAAAGLDLIAVAAVSGSFCLGAIFVRRQLGRPSPMLDVTLFSNRVFSGAVIANMLSMVGLSGFLFFGAQLLQLVLGLSPMESALVLVPGLLATVIAGFAAVRLVERFPVRVLVPVSFLAATLGYVIAAFTTQPTVVGVAIAFTVMGIGIGVAETLTNDVILANVPPQKAGAASAISETAYETGVVLGVAVLGTVLTTVYRAQLAVPGVFEAQKATFETLGATMAFAESGSSPAHDALAESARTAFDLGVQYAAGVGILVALGAAFVSWRALCPRTESL